MSNQQEIKIPQTAANMFRFTCSGEGIPDHTYEPLYSLAWEYVWRKPIMENGDSLTFPSEQEAKLFAATLLVDVINNMPQENRLLLAKYKRALEKIAHISNEVGNDAEHACEMGQIAIDALAV